MFGKIRSDEKNQNLVSGLRITLGSGAKHVDHFFGALVDRYGCGRGRWCMGTNNKVVIIVQSIIITGDKFKNK